ncbi:MAG: acetoin utilization protein AcuC [Bowdeniella nasicola]|nr:acetoin utilization protein AcuC [Bowdeniella nasicola]
MAAPLTLIWDPQLVEYDFGPAHPMAPARLELTFALMDTLGLLADDQITLCAPPLATTTQLERVHDRGYIAALMDPDAHSPQALATFGIGGSDCPIFPGMHHAAARLAGGALCAAQQVVCGNSRRALHFAGGMHHAMPAKAAGFCLYNDAGVAIAELLADGVEPIVYIDIDAHHGDGVERMFRDDRRVTTISIHQHPSTLFPHTGLPTDIGGKNARGHAVNCALPPQTNSAGFLRAIEAVVAPILAEIQPELVITQHGCDGHRDDPLTDMDLSVDCYRQAALELRDLIEAETAGRWVALGGGGYAICRVPPRAWTHLAAVMADCELEPTTAIPASWRAAAASSGRCLGALPTTMTDGDEINLTPFAWGYNPADPVDQAINATRKAAYPELGIDPHSL